MDKDSEKNIELTKRSKKIVIALGGSIICPGEINTAYIRQFYKLVKKKIKKGYKFIIVAGGGKTARNYQKAALMINRVPNSERDWLGIYATYLNAHLLRAVFKKEAESLIFDKRYKVKGFNNHSVIIASGWNPGRSTDFVAVQIAKDLDAEEVIILGKPDYVYDKDPEKYKDALPILQMQWKDYLKMIPLKWTPGLCLPVDPLAARLAKEGKKKVIVANGEDLNNLKNILRGNNFKGTTLVF